MNQASMEPEDTEKKHKPVKRHRKLLICLSAAVIIIIVVVLPAISYLPLTREQMTRSVAMIECRQYYELSKGGKVILYFDQVAPDTTFDDISLMCDSGETHQSYSVACWVNRYALAPSCRGRLLSITNDDNSYRWRDIVNGNIQKVVGKVVDKLKKRRKQLRSEIAELNDYLNVHNVKDEGFVMVASYAQKRNAEKDSIDRIMNALGSLDSGSVVKIVCVNKYSVLFRDTEGKYHRAPCHPVTDNDQCGYRLMQIEGGRTPEGVRALYFHQLLPWRGYKDDILFIASFDGMMERSFDAAKSKSSLMPGKLLSDLHSQARHNVPSLLVQDGSPVFSEHGCFLGISRKGSVIGCNQFGVLFDKLK
jgi:hypothetical protein